MPVLTIPETKRVMDPIPLNAVWAAAPDVPADTAGTAVAVPVADIAGAAADIAADARAVLAGAPADTAVVAADARAALADAAADVAAAADSAGDFYRHACRARRHCGFHVPRMYVCTCMIDTASRLGINLVCLPVLLVVS